MARGTKRPGEAAGNADEIVQMAWDSLPSAHRNLLESIGASQWQVDVADGTRLLALAPPGVREVIRTAGYRSQDYTHEVIAETYAMLMTRRLREGSGQPSWLDDEIYDLLRRTTEWNG